MRNKGKRIVAVVLLLLVVVLGVASVFVANRLNTQKSVAPNAPTSKPKAAEPDTTLANYCTACTSDSMCTNGLTCIGGLCNRSDANKHRCYVTANSCATSFTVNPPACVQRKACGTEPCTPPALTDGSTYCPVVSCDNKKIYKDDAANTAGTYLKDAAHLLPAGSAVYPGDQLIFSMLYTAPAGSAFTDVKVTDAIDPRLQIVDTETGCTQNTNSAGWTDVTCTIGNVAAGATAEKAIRVKVKQDSVMGLIGNVATIASSFKDPLASAPVESYSRCRNTVDVVAKPVVKLACTSKVASTEDDKGTIYVIGKGQTFTYTMNLTNSGNADATDVFLSDPLSDKLTFVDSASGCSFDATSKKVSCKTSLKAGETKKVSFRAKTVDTVADKDVISNKAMCALTAEATTGSECGVDLTVKLPFITAKKEAYKDNTNNTAGSYQLTDTISTVSKNQTFAYAVQITNTGTGTASGINITDPMTGEHQDQLSFVDADKKCNWTANDKTIKCNLDLQPGASTKIAFRMKVGDGAANGDIIKNIGHVVLGNQDIPVTKDLTISSVVGCNNTCTTDSECSNGLKCDSTSKMCRALACTIVESCVCPATVTEAPTKVVTQAPVKTVVVTKAPAKTKTTVAATEAPTEVAQQPEELLKTGIFDIPGVGIFGGGLILTIVGLLLAL